MAWYVSKVGHRQVEVTDFAGLQQALRELRRQGVEPGKARSCANSFMTMDVRSEILDEHVPGQSHRQTSGTHPHHHSSLSSGFGLANAPMLADFTLNPGLGTIRDPGVWNQTRSCGKSVR